MSRWNSIAHPILRAIYKRENEQELPGAHDNQRTAEISGVEYYRPSEPPEITEYVAETPVLSTIRERHILERCQSDPEGPPERHRIVVATMGR